MTFSVAGDKDHKRIIATFMLRKRIKQDRIFRLILFAAGGYILVIMGLLFLTLSQGSIPVLEYMGLEFFYGIDWNTVEGRETYGILPYVIGTLVSSAIAMVIAVPVSLMIGIFLSEMTGPRVSTPISFIIEILASVPSVIYGLWAVFVFRFWLVDYVELPLHNAFGDNLFLFARTPFGLDIFTAGIVLAIMIIPIISAVMREIMKTVPDSQREAAYSLGATRWEMVKTAIVPYAKSGLLGASILGLGRAIGETILVTMVIGGVKGAAAIPDSPFAPSNTIAAIIAQNFAEASGLQLSALIGGALVLVILAFGINLLAHFMVSRMVKTVPTA
jgi:phosphate transport system permease protein